MLPYFAAENSVGWEIKVTKPNADRESRLIALFAATSLIAVSAGCWVADLAGVHAGVWGRMIAAWAVGLGIAIALSRASGAANSTRSMIGVAGIALLLALGFADAGLEGVHRWIVIGPVRFNVAALALPLALVLLAGVSRAWQLALSGAIMLLLVAQPDASQATAFGAGAICLLWSKGRDGIAAAAMAATALLAMVAWLRPDPLAAVPEVEGIVALAWQQGPALAITAVAALAGATLSPLVASSAAHRGPAAWALATYMAVSAIIPAVGAFPVPLIGMSMSPIIGFWIGIGILAQRRANQ